MLHEFAYTGDGDPHEDLSHARELVRRVRAAQRATWFPLLVLAAVTFVAIPVERYGGRHVGPCGTISTPHGTGFGCVAYSSSALVYWPIALVLAYVAIAALYLRQSQTRGLGTRVRPYIVAGVILAAAVTIAALWVAHRARLGGYDFLGLHVGPGPTLIGRLTSPACAIGLGLLVLAWAERSLALLVFTLGYLVVVLVPLSFGWTVAPPWAYMPHLAIPGGVLLLGAVGFGLAQKKPVRLSAA